MMQGISDIRTLLFVIIVVCISITESHAEVVDIPTRDSSIRALIENPDRATHLVVLLSGGKGKVEITPNGKIGAGKGNFAIRTRNLLQVHGFATAALSPPRDIPNLKEQRHRDEYATDIGNVIAYLRDKHGLPVWLHGTSRGAISIAYTIPKITDPKKIPNGIILSASVTRPGGKLLPTVFDGDLEKITGPALVLHHQDDPCEVTPPEDARKVLDALANATPKALQIIDGGGQSARGRDCGPRTQHGFIDVENRAIDEIAAFIKAQN